MEKLRITIYRLRFTTLFSALYALISILFTWPLVLNLSTSTYGFSGDNFGFIYYLWWWRYVRANNLDLHFSHLQEAPFGKILYPETGNIAFFWPVKILTFLTNEVAGYNLLLLLSFPLAGAAMYLLCREVLRRPKTRHPEFISGSRPSGSEPIGFRNKFGMTHASELAAFVGGLIFAFCSYHLWKAYNHLDLSLIYVIPLFLWAWIRFEKVPNVKRAVVLGLGAFLTVVTNYYYAYFAGLMALGLFLGSLLRDKKLSKKTLKGYSLAILVAVILSFPFLRTTLSGLRGANPYGQNDIYDRPLENLLLLSARPWDYLIPSRDHPVFGSVVERVHKKIETLSNDFKTQPGPPHERTIFLGFFTIVGALCSVYYALRSRRHPDPPEVEKDSSIASLSQNDTAFEFYFPFWFTIAFLMLTSFPPFIYFKGVKFLFPAYFLHKILPMFRSYSRLGLCVLALMVPLAVLSFDRLLRKFQKSPQRIAITCIASAFILFEFINFPPAKILDFSKIPSSYQWLADQREEFVIAEYPKMFSLADGYMFQRVHLKPIFNPHGWSPYYKLWDWVLDFYEDETVDRLAALGVRYALVHKKLLFPQENLVDDLWSVRALSQPLQYEYIPEGLVLVEDFEETAIFEVKVDPEPIMGVIFKENDQYVTSWSKKEWFWYGTENKVYLMNLIEREIKVKLSFSGSGGIAGLIFNGDSLLVGKSDDVWELVLHPGENIVEVVSNIPFQFSRVPKIEF